MSNNTNKTQPTRIKINTYAFGSVSKNSVKECEYTVREYKKIMCAFFMLINITVCILYVNM